MSSFERVTLTGGVTWIGEPRKTHKGDTVVNLSVKVTKDKLNRETNQWEQDSFYYESLTCFKRIADNVIKSLHPGDIVLVTGRRDAKPSYTDKNGVEHNGETQITVDSIGPDLGVYAWKSLKDETRASAPSSAPARARAAAPAPAPSVAAVAAPTSEPATTGGSEATDPLADFNADMATSDDFGGDPW